VSSIIKLGGEPSSLARPPARSTSFLAPMPPEQAAQRLDEALHGKRRNKLLITPQRLRSRFDGGVQGSAFWVQTKGATFNPMERRVDGELVPLSGSTEVRCQLRNRGAASATIALSAGTLGLFSVFLLAIAIVVNGFGWGAGAVALLTILVGLWALLIAALYSAKRVARSGEEESMRFVATTLEAPDRDLIGL
jgi:hypothetical protein